MEKLPEISLACFKNSSFAIMQKGSTLREIYDNLILEEESCPHILLETGSCHNLYHMVVEGICCSIFPITYAMHNPRVTYFSISQNPVWKVYTSYKKGSYLSNVAKDFITIATDYWSKKLKLFIP